MNIEQAMTVFAIVATNLGTVLALYMHSDRKIDENRKDTNTLIEAIRIDLKAIQQEIKDFHGRLCAIEERGKK